MKVLFVGEGSHDIGEPAPLFNVLRQARGAVATLARRAAPQIDRNSVALAWREIVRFNPSVKKRGYSAKIQAAVLIAVRGKCAATVVVADRDRDNGRQAELDRAAAKAGELFQQHRIAWGLAIESIEAWTLGAPDAIAEELGVTAEAVNQLYPRGIHVEDLFEGSGKEHHRPKKLLERIAQLKHRQDSTDFRQAIAERTDVTALEQACPQGFAPFKKRLVDAVG